MSRSKAILSLIILVALVAITLSPVTTLSNRSRKTSLNPCLAKIVTAPIRPVFGGAVGPVGSLSCTKKSDPIYVPPGAYKDIDFYATCDDSTGSRNFNGEEVGTRIVGSVTINFDVQGTRKYTIEGKDIVSFNARADWSG